MQITLKAAREMNGYTLEQVAEYCGVTADTISDIEDNSESITYDLLSSILNLYGVSADYVYLGIETECINHNRLNRGVTFG
jgi:transcriptional regulator with XRE-family HTH domain